jgi:hypothetical protein
LSRQPPCGPDVDGHVSRAFIDVGFDGIALVQMGAWHREEFMAWAQRELVSALCSV